ncbi:MAG: low affinity iron permease family protein [Abditibacteriaceae bacterium]
MNDWFRKFAKGTSKVTGSSWVFLAALLLVIVWGISGPMFKYSETWQLVINTGTTIITFLMVFLIQNTQNRDSASIHLKLDELLRSTKEAKNLLIGSEDLSDEDLENIKRIFEQLKAEDGHGAPGSIAKLEGLLFTCGDDEYE